MLNDTRHKGNTPTQLPKVGKEHEGEFIQEQFTEKKHADLFCCCCFFYVVIGVLLRRGGRDQSICIADKCQEGIAMRRREGLFCL